MILKQAVGLLKISLLLNRKRLTKIGSPFGQENVA